VSPADEEVPEAPSEAPLTDPDARRNIALITGVAATVAFVIWRVVVALNGHEPLPMDMWWQDLMVSLRSDVWLVLAWIPAVGGGTVAMIVILIVSVLLFLWRKRKWDAVNMASAIILVVAIGAPMAAVIARERPEGSLAESVDTSFPSGHTAVATTFTITLALLLRKWWLWLAGAVWVIWMMWSRTYLSAHWLSDVFAGFFEGVAVATIVWCAVEALRDRRAKRHLADPSRPGELPESVR
jgi:membrane-associated phospholipid phosphatase